MNLRSGVAILMFGTLTMARAQSGVRADVALVTAINPDTSGLYRIGDDVSQPELISSVSPDFTAKHVRKHFRGVCAVALTVDAAGQPQNVRVVRSIGEGKAEIQKADAAELDRTALDAVKQYRFAPALFKGRPVPVAIKIEVDVDVI